MPLKKFKKKYPRASRALQVAGQALSIARSVASIVNVEYKLIDTGIVTTTPGSSGSIVSLNACSEGTTSSTRNGLSIKMKSLELRGFYTMDAQATNTVLRSMLVLDNSPNGSKATITEILESVDVIAMRNNINFGRFRVLYDRTFTMSGTGEENGVFHKYIKLNKHVKYSGSGGTENDIESGQLLFVQISNEDPGATPQEFPPSVKWNTRVRFVDN